MRFAIRTAKDLGLLAFHYTRQIADYHHIDVLAAFDGYNRFLGRSRIGLVDKPVDADIGSLFLASIRNGFHKRNGPRN